LGAATAVAAYNAFVATYGTLAALSCDFTLTGTLAGVTLTVPGVYCFTADATLTGTLTLNGPSNGIWIYQIGTSGTGALTGTNFTVAMAGATQPCNVTWWVKDAATMTDSHFIGTILAGADITLTNGTFTGNTWSRGYVTITGTVIHGCASVAVGGGGGGGGGSKCNQGIGNGPELCDLGNSNNHNPTNDETGRTPGTPGPRGNN
jgi:Ice-binding-like